MKRVLLAGATGYLGKHISIELKRESFDATVIVRNKKKFESFGIGLKNVVEVDFTEQSNLENACKGIDTVISCLGITKQKDHLSYMDVDYQMNKNLLDAAKKSGVRKFIYISVLHGEELKQIKLCKAKEAFVDELKKSSLEYSVVRPSGFFSDMKEFYQMAKKGRIFLFGDGQSKINPIHGSDLAQACIELIESKEKEVNIGGPEILSQEEIAEIAFDSLGKKAKIVHIADSFRLIALFLGRFLMNKYNYGPFEFFMTASAMDFVGTPFGKKSLYPYFKALK